MKHCTEMFLTAEPLSAWFGGKEPFIGCDNLVCLSCRKIVKHLDHRSFAQHHFVPPTDDIRDLYDSAEPASSSLLVRSDGSRVYFCRCYWYAVHGSPQGVRLTDGNWQCGGHEP